ncbi:MAG: GNAT family N-acetyltransferase, partial [Acidobacteriota bacterium]|nr:GNAT family N-acetyltransferase [Acidobacteriota bacterium]
MPAAHLPHIRALQTDDLQDALTLSTSAGWNQRIDDWRLLRTVARDGSFAAVSGNRVVGTAMAIDYGEFAWIAMMLVEPSHRGRGLGARLLEAAMTAVRPEFPIRLDATPAGRGLYLKYGFEDEAMLTRSVAPARTGGAPVTPGGPAVRSLTSADLTDVARADRTVFGGDR